MDEDTKNEFRRRLEAYKEAQERGDFKLCESIAAELLLLSVEEAQNHPNEILRFSTEAHEHEDCARWEQAVAAHRQALALAESEVNHAMIFKKHADLSSLFAILGDNEQALQEALEAVEAARKADLPPLLLRALEGVTQRRLTRGEIAASFAVVEEAVHLVPVEKIHDTQRARLKLLRAKCLLELDRITEDEQELAIAWQILAPQEEVTMFAGIQGSLAIWWEINARIKAKMKDFETGAQSMGKAVEFRRTISQLPHVENLPKHHGLAKILHEYAIMLEAAGEIEEARKASDESQEILTRLGVTLPPGRGASN